MTKRENISLWFQNSEPDYYMFFLKSWIPFNSWYVEEYPTLNKKDSTIIRELQDNLNSKPRKIIENFLSNSDKVTSQNFQSYLAELHYHLENIPLFHNGQRLSFKNIFLTENPITYKNAIDSNGNVYKVEKTSSYWQAYIQDRGGRVLLDFRKPIYDLQEMERDFHYLRLDRKIQKQIHNLYKDINPSKPISIISTSTKKNEYLLLKSENSCKMILDETTIAKACIKVLYALRCMLFHGEVAPTNTNKIIYKQSFLMLDMINKQIQ